MPSSTGRRDTGHVVEYAYTPPFGSQEEHNRRERLTVLVAEHPLLTLVNHDGRRVTIITAPTGRAGATGPGGQQATHVESCTEGLIATFEHLDAPGSPISAHEAAALLAVNVMSRPAAASLGASPATPNILNPLETR